MKSIHGEQNSKFLNKDRTSNSSVLGLLGLEAKGKSVMLIFRSGLSTALTECPRSIKICHGSLLIDRKKLMAYC